MREMLQVTSAIVGEGLGHTVALVTDRRFVGTVHGATQRSRLHRATEDLQQVD